MSTVYYLKDIDDTRPMSPLTALLLPSVFTVAMNVCDYNRPTEELTDYLTELVRDATLAERLSNRVLRLMTHDHVIANDHRDDARLQVAEELAGSSEILAWDPAEAQEAIVAELRWSDTDDVNALTAALSHWLDAGPFVRVPEDCIRQPQPITDVIIGMMDRLFIRDGGESDYSAIGAVTHALQSNGYDVKHCVLERDRFGPLICGLRTPRGTLVYG